MVLNQKTRLTGNQDDRILQILSMAGWYENRYVDISQVEEYYRKQRVPLIDAAKLFFTEYHGIADSWFIMYDSAPPSGPARSPDFHFDLYPSSLLDEVNEHVFEDGSAHWGEEQLLINQAAKEATTHVGEIGYYYPAGVWIGESGHFYTLHEYDNGEVHIYHTLMELLKWELKRHRIESATVLLRNKPIDGSHP